MSKISGANLFKEPAKWPQIPPWWLLSSPTAAALLNVKPATRLTSPETTAEDFPAHARFALDTLPALTSRPDQIKTLRQTILNLAVRGKLVEQNAADEPQLNCSVKLLQNVLSW